MEEQPQQPVEETNPSIEQTPQEQPKSKTGLIIAIVVVSLLIAGGAIAGYFFYSQNSADAPLAPSLGMPVPEPEDVDEMVVEDEEITLETYTNEKNNYQLQHQDNWEIETLVNGEARILSPNDIETDCKGECGFSALISNIRKVEFGTIVSYLENEKTRLMSEGGETRVNTCLKDLEYFQWGDHRAAQYITCDFANPTIISFMDNSRLVHVTVYATDNSELLEILSTFKFNGLVDTSDWETYHNEEYGFEISYPSGWEVKIHEDNQRGYLLSILDPENPGNPGYANELTIQRNDEITDYVTGDFETFDEFIEAGEHTHQIISPTTIDGKKAVELIFGGSGAAYGLFIENNGIFALVFEKAWDKTKLSETAEKVLSTFKFTE